jgi:hypothetical protein
MKLALAAIAGATAAASAYAVLRIVQALAGNEVDPALVIWSPHAGFFWRVWTAAYLGGMVAFLAYLAASRNADRTARVLAAAVTLAAVLVAAQGMLLP